MESSLVRYVFATEKCRKASELSRQKSKFADTLQGGNKYRTKHLP